MVKSSEQIIPATIKISICKIQTHAPVMIALEKSRSNPLLAQVRKRHTETFVRPDKKQSLRKKKV